MQYDREMTPATAELSRQLDKWRKTHSAPSPIPDQIWARAVELASWDGIGPVARALRLDYGKLKARVNDAHLPQTGTQGRSQPPGGTSGAMFVEWFSPMAGSIAECSLEVETAAGNRLRVEMKNVAPSGLSTIIRDFVAG